MESIEFNGQIKIRKACFFKKRFYFLNAVKFSCNSECWRCAHLNEALLTQGKRRHDRCRSLLNIVAHEMAEG